MGHGREWSVWRNCADDGSAPILFPLHRSPGRLRYEPTGRPRQPPFPGRRLPVAQRGWLKVKRLLDPENFVSEFKALAERYTKDRLEFCGDWTESGIGKWGHLGTPSELLLAEFRDVATRAGIALGAPTGVSPDDYFLDCLFNKLREKHSSFAPLSISKPVSVRPPSAAWSSGEYASPAKQLPPSGYGARRPPLQRSTTSRING